MQNKRYRDNQLLTKFAPVGGTVVGKPLAIGSDFGFACETVAEGEIFTLDTSGVFEVEAEAVGVINDGSPVYFTAGRADAEFHNDPASGRLVGTAQLDVVAGKSANPVMAAGETGTILVSVLPYANTTAAEAVENAGGADA